MPYNADGSKKKNPTSKDWAKHNASGGDKRSNAVRKTSASNQGGAAVGGGT